MTSSRKGANAVNAKTDTKLLVAMTGKASPAKAAEGDEPVFAYIATMPQPQRGIAERVDTLAARTLPDVQRAVKWGMAGRDGQGHTRVELASVDDLDEHLVASWMKQAAAMPFRPSASGFMLCRRRSFTLGRTTDGSV